MADYNQTISNAIYALGPAPSTKWGQTFPFTNVYGTAKWGEGSNDLLVEVGKVISNSLAPTDSVATLFEAVKTISISLSFTEDMASEQMTQGAWNHDFILPTIEAEDRLDEMWTEDTGSSATWSDADGGSATWTEQ